MNLLAYSFNQSQVFISSLANFLSITPVQVSDGGLLIFPIYDWELYLLRFVILCQSYEWQLFQSLLMMLTYGWLGKTKYLQLNWVCLPHNWCLESLFGRLSSHFLPFLFSTRFTGDCPEFSSSSYFIHWHWLVLRVLCFYQSEKLWAIYWVNGKLPSCPHALAGPGP